MTEQRDRLQPLGSLFLEMPWLRKTNEGLEKVQEKSKKTSEMVEEKLKDRELERSELIKVGSRCSGLAACEVKDELEVKMKKAEAESRSKAMKQKAFQ